MTDQIQEQAGKATGKAAGAAGAAGGNPAVDRLKQEASAFAAAQAQRALMAVGRKLGSATGKLNDVASGDGLGGGGGMLLRGGKKLAEGKGMLRSAIETGAGALKDKATESVKGLFGMSKSEGKGGKSGQKVTAIIEDVDIGVPVREAYNQWTQYQEFSTFMKGVQGVKQEDDVTTNWRAKVLWSNRSWKARITEQVPDERIAWTSEGPKGTTEGTITFHPLGDNLTKVLLVLEYSPSGFFEKTGNVWRAQGRRARLDLKHFRRFLTMQGEATAAWRGEIRDGEVVRDHDEVVAEEEEREQGGGEAEEGEAEAGREAEEPAEDEYESEEEPEDEYDEESEEEPEEKPEDEAESDEYDEEEYGAEDADEDYDEAEEDTEPAAEREHARR